MGYGPNNRATPQEAAADLRDRGWPEADVTTYLEGHGVTGEIAEVSGVPEVPGVDETSSGQEEPPAPPEGLNPYVAGRIPELIGSGWSPAEVQEWALSDHNVDVPDDYFEDAGAAPGQPDPAAEVAASDAEVQENSGVPDVPDVPGVPDSARAADAGQSSISPYVQNRIPELQEHGWTTEQIQDWALGNHGVALTAEQIAKKPGGAGPETGAPAAAAPPEGVDPVAPSGGATDVVSEVLWTDTNGLQGTSTMSVGAQFTTGPGLPELDENAVEAASDYYQSLGYYVIVSVSSGGNFGLVRVYYTSNYNDVRINLGSSGASSSSTGGFNVMPGDYEGSGLQNIVPTGTPVPGAEDRPEGYGSDIIVSDTMTVVATVAPGQSGNIDLGGVALDSGVHHLYDPATGNVYATSNWRDVKKQPFFYISTQGGQYVGTVYQEQVDLPGAQRIDSSGNILMPGDPGYDKASPTTSTEAFSVDMLNPEVYFNVQPIFGNYEDWYLSEQDVGSFSALSASAESVEAALSTAYDSSLLAEAMANMYDPAAAAEGGSGFGDTEFSQAGGISVADWVALGRPQTIGDHKIPEGIYQQWMALSPEELVRRGEAGQFLLSFNMDRPLHGLDKLGDKWFGWDDMAQDIGNLGDNLSWFPIAGPILNMVTDPIEAYADAPAGEGSDAAGGAFGDALVSGVISIALTYLGSGIGDAVGGLFGDAAGAAGAGTAGAGAGAAAGSVAAQPWQQALVQFGIEWGIPVLQRATEGAAASFATTLITSLSQGYGWHDAVSMALEGAAVAGFSGGLSYGTLDLLGLSDLDLAEAVSDGTIGNVGTWPASMTAGSVHGAYAYLAGRLTGKDEHDSAVGALQSFITNASSTPGRIANFREYAAFVEFMGDNPEFGGNPVVAAYRLVSERRAAEGRSVNAAAMASEVNAVVASVMAADKIYGDFTGLGPDFDFPDGLDLATRIDALAGIDEIFENQATSSPGVGAPGSLAPGGNR